MLKKISLFFFILPFLFSFCHTKIKNDKAEKQEIIKIDPKEIIIEKDFLYDQHTLTDTYPYKDTSRVFQWDKIRSYLTIIESLQKMPNSQWGILQNENNEKGEAPVVKNSKEDEYHRMADAYGVEKYQAIPLYASNDLKTPERYSKDGSLVRITEDTDPFLNVHHIYFDEDWMVPKKYVKLIEDNELFNKVIFVDRKNQNIMTLEKSGSKWLVRSMNPATTGLHKPPFKQSTPLGFFVVQEKKNQMIYMVDGSHEKGGFAPHASRFCSGAYIHGIPVNLPSTKEVETSPTLGTTPLSHMCVRVATSHSIFIYDWAPVNKCIVIVIE